MMQAITGFFNVVALVLRVALAGVFGYAASIKLGLGPWSADGGPQAFLFNIKGFEINQAYPGLLPDHLLVPLAFIIPWLELLCAIFLLLGMWTRASALVLAGLLITFIGAIYSVLSRGMEIECGCFGKFGLFCTPGKITECNLIQNAALLTAVLVVWLLGPGFFGVERALGRRGCACGRRGACDCGAKRIEPKPASPTA